MQPNIMTIDTNVGFKLSYEPCRPLKTDLIEFIQTSFDAFLEDINAYLSIGDSDND